MTPQEMLLNQKLSLLQLAKQINNIKQACNTFGVSRQHYYDVKNAYEELGVEGLKFRSRNPTVMPNQTDKILERKIVEYSLENSSFGKDRVANDMHAQGIYITSNGIESIWRRNKMCNRKQRFILLEKRMRDKNFVLSPSQVQELVMKSKSVGDRHVLSYFPGYLLCQDTFEVGYIKGVGKIYLQVVIDSFGSFAFGKLYNYKTALTAADILIDKVLPLYSTFSLPVLNILTDNGKEYCGNLPDHEYEFVLNLFNISHRKTRIKCPQTNGFVERFNRTVLDEFFAVVFRTNWYSSIEQLQKDLDIWLHKYNFRRTH
jgi:transposase InsO family protein